MPYEEWISGHDDEGLLPPADENDMIAVNYTSGTTGRPKGVVYTHRGAYPNAVSVAMEFELTVAGRPPSARSTTGSAMPWNAASTGSNATGPWPPGTTSPPSATRQSFTSPSSTTGY